MKRIVVLGGGFGGLFTVINLCKYSEDFQITLINRDNNFIFTPLLHEVATAGIRENNAIYPLKESLTDKRIKIVAAEIEKADLKKKVVKTSKGNFKYDYLVIALGSKTNLNVPGLKEYCLELKTIKHAREIRKAVFDEFKKGDKKISFAVIGAGPTGVELAAEMRELGDLLIEKRFKNLNKKDFSVMLLQRGSSMLPQLPKNLVSKVEDELKRLNVDLRYNCDVEKVTKNGIYVNKKLIPCSIKIAAVGVKASKIKTVPEIYEENGIPVRKDLRVEEFKNIFALGDVALHKDNGEYTPKLAQAAVQEAKYVAKNIINLIRKDKTEDFKFKMQGFLLSVGQNYAVAEIKPFFLSGFFAWLLWRTIYLSKVVGLKNKIYLAYDWTIGLFRRRFVNNGE